MRNGRCRRRGLALWELILMGAFLALGALILFPLFGRLRDNDDNHKSRYSCRVNLTWIMLGMKQYVQDYDGKYPFAKTSGPDFGWAQSLQPYVKSASKFQCPDRRYFTRRTTVLPPSERGYTDYWFNSRLSGKSEADVEFISNMISLGDGNDGTDQTDASYHLSSIPPAWQSQDSPMDIHWGGAYLAFADGHAKWLAASGWKDSVTNSFASFNFRPTRDS